MLHNHLRNFTSHEFIINLDTVYNKPLCYLLKTWIEFIRFRGFRVKKKEWLQWITGIFFSSLINNFYNILNECIDYIILQYVIVLPDNRSFNVKSSCCLFNQFGLMSQFSGLNRNHHWVKKNAEIVCHII